MTLINATKIDIEYIVGVPRTAEWVELKPYVFEKDRTPFGLVSVLKFEDVVMINSISIENEDFTIGMRRLIVQTVRDNDKVILMSTKEDSCLTRLMDEFRYNDEHSHFTKGL